LCSLRVSNRPAQAMETEGVEEVTGPVGRLTGTKLTAVALHEHALQTPVHVVIDLPKLDGGVASAKVRAPSAEHRIEMRNGVAHIPVTRGARRERLHPLAYPTHRALSRPPLQVVHPAVPLLPEVSTHALAQVTPEKVKPLTSA
jgi:hypothetical protein